MWPPKGVYQASGGSVGLLRYLNQPPRHQLRMRSREQMPSSDLAIADWTTKVFGPVLIYKYKNAVFTVFIGGGTPPFHEKKDIKTVTVATMATEHVGIPTNGMAWYTTGHLQIINITFIGIISLKWEIIKCPNLTRMGNLTKMGHLTKILAIPFYFIACG